MREMLIVAKAGTLSAATKRLCRPFDAGNTDPFGVSIVVGYGRMMAVVRAHGNDNTSGEIVNSARGAPAMGSAHTGG